MQLLKKKWYTLKIEKTALSKQNQLSYWVHDKRKHSCEGFSFPSAFLSLFYFFFFCSSLINHPGLVRWDYSFSSICVKFKSRKQCPETAWHQYSFSALQVAGPCCFCLFSSMRLQGAMSTGERNCILQFCFAFCCCCLCCMPPSHLCLQGHVLRHYSSTRAIPVHCNEPSLSHFSHTQEKTLLTSLMPSKRLQNLGHSSLEKKNSPSSTTLGDKRK